MVDVKMKSGVESASRGGQVQKLNRLKVTMRGFKGGVGNNEKMQRRVQHKSKKHRMNFSGS